jgi:ubiquinone biosynthesis protein
VARWIARELSPLMRIRTLAEEAQRALSALARMAEPPPAVAPTPAEPQAGSRLFWFALGVLTAALAVAAWVWVAR